MAQLFNNGIPVSTGFKIEGEYPVDDRLRVETFTDLAALQHKYNTMIVRVMDEGQSVSGFTIGVDYIYDEVNNQWNPTGSGSQDLGSVLSQGNTSDNSIILASGGTGVRYSNNGQKYDDGTYSVIHAYDALTNDVTYNWPSKDTNDTVAMLSDVDTVASTQFLPKDFFISCNYQPFPIMAQYMKYITDEIRDLDINILIGGLGAYSTRNVLVIDEETIVITGEMFDGSFGGPPEGNNFVLTLKNCRIKDNILTFESYLFNELPEIRRDPITNTPNIIHAAVYHRNFIYLATRIPNTTIDNTQIIKINPFDLTDIKYLELPTAGMFDVQVGEMVAYKNNLYLLGVNIRLPVVNRFSSFIRVDENLTESEVLFQLGNAADNPIRLIGSNPFDIYNDKVYIPYTNATNTGTRSNNTGILVYDLLKKIRLQNVETIFTTGQTLVTEPHWFKIFNNSIIYTTNTSARYLFRFDVKTLVLQEYITLPANITNNNTISKDGYIYLNPELDHTKKLIKVKYNDFTDYQEISPIGWYSLGSTEPNWSYEESFKTKTSDFINDGADGSNPYQSAAQVLVAINGAKQVIFSTTYVGLPTTGSEDKIYVVKTGAEENLIYRWSDATNQYIQIGGSSGGGGTWGTITGTLSDQTDLQTVLDTKIELDSASPVNVDKVWYGTQAQYNALGVYDPAVEYNVETDGKVSTIGFNGNASPTYSAGTLVYDTANESLTFFNNDNAVSLQIGQELWLRVRNDTGSTIPNGSAVYVSGSHSSGLPQISLAQANSSTTTIVSGLTTESIATGAIGYVTLAGIVNGLNTAAFTAGASIFLSSTVAGGLTATAPTAPNFRYRVGIVTKSDATTGSIQVTPSTAMLGNGTANQLFGMNAAGTAQEVKTIAGTANQVTVTHTANTVTISGGWLSGSATLDFPSTAAASSSDLTITVTGAALGDCVMLGVPNGSVIANANYSSWVSATNTVSVRFNNYSSVPLNPASGTFSVKVFKP